MQQGNKDTDLTNYPIFDGGVEDNIEVSFIFLFSQAYQKREIPNSCHFYDNTTLVEEFVKCTTGSKL